MLASASVRQRPACRTKLPLPTDRLRLGDSELQVSPFCLGMIPNGSPETVLAAFDVGINCFFVSVDLHWPLYASLREGVAQLLRRGGGIRDEVVIVATSYMSRANLLRMPFQELLDCVPELERLDVLAIGSCYANDPLERRAALNQHRKTGFAGSRASGASFHDRAMVAPTCNDAEVDVAFVRYNARHAGARTEVFPKLATTPTLLYGFKSMSGFVSEDQLARIASLPEGVWKPTATDHYRFALSSPQLDGILCSPQSPAEVIALANAMGEAPLDEEEQEHMIDLALLAAGRAEIYLDPNEPE